MKAIPPYVMASIVVAIFASPVRAQEATGGNSNVTQSAHTRKLHRVHIMESTSDQERVGDLLELTADTVRVLIDDRVEEFRLDAVRWIDREGDSLKNGAIVGAAVMGTWCALVCGQGLDDRSGLAPAVVANTAVGALIGVAMDAMNRGRTNLYSNSNEVAGQARSRALAIAFQVSF